MQNSRDANENGFPRRQIRCERAAGGGKRSTVKGGTPVKYGREPKRATEMQVCRRLVRKGEVIHREISQKISADCRASKETCSRRRGAARLVVWLNANRGAKESARGRTALYWKKTSAARKGSYEGT